MAAKKDAPRDTIEVKPRWVEVIERRWLLLLIGVGLVFVIKRI